MKQIKFCSLILFICLSNTVMAQKFGKITGTVLDAETGDALPGANIIVSGTTLGAATDSEGYYIILRLPPGIYELRAEFIGYQRVVTQNVQVLTDLTTPLDFSLRPQTVELGEEVVVVAEKPLIRKDLTSAEARVQAEEIQRLPVQELGDILNLQAGISRDAGGGIHIRGGRSTDVAYMVNGVRITDDFTRTQSLQIENESIQELQVISGTFNAEYGEALTGVINIVTKAGTNKFTGNFETWSGDYLSNRDDLFFNIEDVSPAANYNFQGSLSGPIWKDKITFFATARRFETDGWLYGPLAFLPSGRAVASGDSLVRVSGDSSAVAMNSRKRWSGQASLEWRINGPLKFKIDFLGSTEDRRNYNHGFKLNPLGARGDEENGYTVIANLTHALGSKTFYELTGSVKRNELTSVLFDDPFDSRYVHPDSLNAGANQFLKGGTDLARFERYTKSLIGKFDLTSQMSKRHQVKTGVEIKFDEVFMDDFSLVPAEDENTGQQVFPFAPDLPDISEPRRSQIEREPFSFAVYVQDKIEYESLIINFGLRFDRFDPKGQVPVDLSDPNIFNPFRLGNIYRDSNGDGTINPDEQSEANKLTITERQNGWYRSTSAKTQLSPRLGVAYPITDEGVLHFSFGIFRQTPDYQALYRGDQLKVTTAAGLQGPFGNPDLNPKRTTMYELGLQQQLSENIGADLTLYYQDIRDWVSTGPALKTDLAGVTYSRRINRDFANVLGVTLALHRRFANDFSFDVDYTFQVAEGTNSNPDEEFFTQRDGGEPTKQLTPLGWDQRHALNASAFVGSRDWGVSFISRFTTGQPYTPVISTFSLSGSSIIGGLEKNSRNKPDLLTVDLTAFKLFDFNNYHVRFFAKVFNLFDARNPVNVFGDTGEPDFTFNELQAVSADPTFFDQPQFYSEPRRLQIGLSLGFN